MRLPLDTPRDQVMVELNGMVGAVKDAAADGFKCYEDGYRGGGLVLCDKHVGLSGEASDAFARTWATIYATAAACPDCSGGGRSET